MLTEFEQLVLLMRHAYEDGYTRCYFISQKALDKYNELKSQVDNLLWEKIDPDQKINPELKPDQKFKKLLEIQEQKKKLETGTQDPTPDLFTGANLSDETDRKAGE